MVALSAIGMVLALVTGQLPADQNVVPVKLVEVPEYCEGIVFDHAGNAYISHGKVITKITPERKTSLWATTGAPNGHKVLADGTHLVCDASQHAVLRLDANGKVIGKASAECAGKPLRGPNDLTLDPQGGFYFTDPGGSDDKKLIGTVHYVDPQGKTHLVAEGLAFPNGIVLRPDGKTLLVAESKRNRVLAYEVQAPGKVGTLKVFAELPAKGEGQIDNQPDGMCLDEAGNLYVAHYGMRQVQVLGPDGKLLRRYPGGNLTTSNVAFGDPNMDQLYVTGAVGKEQGSRGGLYLLDLKGVRGLTILPKKQNPPKAKPEKPKPKPEKPKPKPAPPAKPPHVVFFLADDLGWTDVGYHGGNVQTPNIDRLAKEGVQLNQFYVMPVCSPTRGCLMTGRYPIRYGLQSGVVRPWSKHGLPLEERTLPQALKEAGYRTAIVGKWHLGHFDPAYLPTRRGFDHQYGHYNGAIDYNTHVRDGGLDWHRNDKGLREEGYSTQLLANEASRLIAEQDANKPLFLYVPFNAPHAPLQAPEEYVNRYQHIQDRNRRLYCAMVTCLDDSIGQIVAALEKRGLRENTLLVFSSDNGGPLAQSATNGPLRAGKATLYEGGVRVVAWANWPGKLKSGVVNAPLHAVDWYPTLLKLAGAPVAQKLPLDGRDLWPTIAEGKPSPHEEILLNSEPERGALRRGDWKLVVHNPAKAKAAKKQTAGVELFNLADDPNEKTNLADKHPEKVKELRDRLNAYAQQAVPPRGGEARDPRPADFKAPAVYGEKGG